MVVAEGLNGVTIRAVNTGEILQRLPGHPGNAREVARHPNGRHVASVCDRHVLRIWDLTTGQPVLSFDDCQVGRRSAMAFCPTGDELGFVQDRGAHQLNFIDGSPSPRP